MKSDKNRWAEREKIIAEYLAGGTTYRKLQSKYSVDFRVLQSWVQKFKGKGVLAPKPAKAGIVKTIQDLPEDVKLLQEELRKAKLHNQLLETLIDIGKEQYGFDLRKKTGTRQS